MAEDEEGAREERSEKMVRMSCKGWRGKDTMVEVGNKVVKNGLG